MTDYLQHGRRHGPGGSDPIIPAGIYFDVDNEGGWLYIVANDSTDIDFGELAILIADKLGAGLELVSSDGSTESTVVVLPDAIEMQADAGGTAVGLALGVSMVQISIGGTPLFQLDADGTLHLKTGAAVVADL